MGCEKYVVQLKVAIQIECSYVFISECGKFGVALAWDSRKNGLYKLVRVIRENLLSFYCPCIVFL